MTTPYDNGCEAIHCLYLSDGNCCLHQYPDADCPIERDRCVCEDNDDYDDFLDQEAEYRELEANWNPNSGSDW
jgi:hypothetical protein